MSQADKWAFIVNPVAGNGFAKSYLKEVRRRVAEQDFEAEIVLTAYKGHATELSGRFLNNGFGHIVAVGGDGTINETMRALVHQTDTVFGVIPAGTGNDFIPITGFPVRFKDVDWDIFFQKKTILMDIGKCNENYFLNGMGLGFDAQVAAENYYDIQKGRKGGPHKYLWHIIKTILYYKEQAMVCQTDHTVETSDCFINTIGIGRRYAGGYYLTPKAIGNDGLLDVCMIRKLGRMGRFRLLPKVPKGTHLSNPHVHYYQTNALKLKFDREVPHHLDGELFFASEYDVSILPKALQIIYNPGGPHFFNDQDSKIHE